MNDILYYNELYLIYKDLLKEKTQEVFDLYYGENLSMQEIADIMKISKSRVGAIINSTKKILDNYENKLKLFEKKEEIIKLIEKKDYSKIESIVRGE